LTNADIQKCKQTDGRFLFICCPQTLLQAQTGAIYPSSLEPLPEQKYFLYQFEHLDIKSEKNMNSHIIQLIKNAKHTFDYSEINLAYYPEEVKSNVSVLLPPVVSWTTTKTLTEKKYDILFCGNMNERREKILNELRMAGYKVLHVDKTFGTELTQLIREARIFLNIHHSNSKSLETCRLNEAVMSPDTHIVSEKNHRDPVEKMYSDRVHFTEKEDIVKTVKVVLIGSDKKFSKFNIDMWNTNVNICLQKIFKDLLNPLINILLRHTYRPSYFPKCIESILKQTYKNIRIICCYDDDNCLDYLKTITDVRFEYFYINIVSTEHYKYNLYCNTLLDKVNDGWIMFLDDDDMFSTDKSLQNVVNNILNDNTFIYWQVKLGSTIIYPLDIKHLNAGQITSNGFCFHSKFKDLSRWECKRASDYTFVKQLLVSNNFLHKEITTVLTQTQHNMKGLNGNKEQYDIFYTFNDIIQKNKIKQIYVSKSLTHLTNRIYKIYGLTPYSSLNHPCIFFGMYDNDDYNMITNHKSTVYAMPGGSDTLAYHSVKNIKNIKFFSLSNDMKNRLSSININSELVNFNLVDKELFKPVEKVGRKVFIYDGIRKKSDNATIYGKIYHDEVRKRLPYYEYIFSSDLGLSYEKMPEIYAQCFIGLRLTPHDGNANMVQEMEAMKIPVVHNQSKYGLKWKNVDDIIKYITNLSEKLLDHNKQIVISSLNIDMYQLKKITEAYLNIIRENINSFYSYCKTYKNILFICGDYPGYGGAATNCDKLQTFFINKGHNTYSFYYNFETGENAVYKKTNITCVDDINNFSKIMTDVNFKPNLIILKSFVNVDLKRIYNCPLIYLVGGIYKNNLDKYYYNLHTNTEQNKYINYSVINQIKQCDYTFVNSSHTKSILEKYYNIQVQILYSTFIDVYNKQLSQDDNFKKRKYEYGLIVSNFNRNIKNIDESISFLKDKQNVILIGKNSSQFKTYGFECIDLVEHDKMSEYYKQIKYLQQDSFYESCSNVKIEALFNGCKIKPVVVVSSTQYPGYGGAATNAYNIIKFLRENGFKVCGVFFHTTTNVNFDPDEIGGIFIYNETSVIKKTDNVYNNIQSDVLKYTRSKIDICLAKNYLAPIYCKELFSCYTVYLVSGINHQNAFFSNMNYYEIMNLNSVPDITSEIICLNTIDKILFNSNLVKDFYNKFYTKYKDKFIKNIIDTTSLCNKYDIIKNNVKIYDIVLCSSSLIRTDKNNLFLIKVLMDPIFNKFKKCIIGSDSKQFECIPNSFFTQIIDNSKCISFFKESRILLYPSLCDANPNTIQEAYYSKCIPLISNCIGNYDIYPNEIVCKTFDVLEWKQKLYNLLTLTNLDEITINYNKDMSNIYNILF